MNWYVPHRDSCLKSSLHHIAGALLVDEPHPFDALSPVIRHSGSMKQNFDPFHGRMQAFRFQHITSDQFKRPVFQQFPGSPGRSRMRTFQPRQRASRPGLSLQIRSRLSLMLDASPVTFSECCLNQSCSHRRGCKMNGLSYLDQSCKRPSNSEYMERQRPASQISQSCLGSG